jgi:integrase/recombinase XerC
MRAYAGDLEHFRAFVGVATSVDAATLLVTRTHGEANALVFSYRAHMIGRVPKLAPATINRRLAAVRSLVKLARTLGLVDWALDVPNLPSQAYRDTRGPNYAAVRAMLEAGDTHDARAIELRDRAILRLLHDLALRRAEIVSLDVEHVDLQGETVLVLGKGHVERESLTLPAPTVDALRAWVDARGAEPGPLFMRLDRARRRDHTGARLSATALYRMVRKRGERVGARARPHGLRHAAVTRALDLTHGDIRSVQRFSRHRDPRTLLRYDDNRRDLGGEIARLVATDAVTP